MTLTKEETKAAMKEALREWLDEKYTAFGKWTLLGFASAVFIAGIYFVLTSNGWHLAQTELAK